MVTRFRTLTPMFMGKAIVVPTVGWNDKMVLLLDQHSFWSKFFLARRRNGRSSRTSLVRALFCGSFRQTANNGTSIAFVLHCINY